MISIKEPIIHTFNKDETVVVDLPEIYQAIKNRKNLLLLGDSVSDATMASGFAYDNLLKIGFLNFGYDKDETIFTDNFDIVLTGDGDLSYVNELLREFKQ